MTDEPRISIGREKAIELAHSHFWELMEPREIAEFQMGVCELCIPFDVFHESLQKALGRPVWTHEFGLNFDGLAAELRGERKKPTMQEIIELIPEGKRIVLVVDESPCK